MQIDMAEMAFNCRRQDVALAPGGGAGRNVTVAAPLLVSNRSYWALGGVRSATAFILSPLGLAGQNQESVDFRPRLGFVWMVF